MTDGDARDPLIGSLFNNYRIDALLAQGGMGAVYLLRDATLPTIRKVLKVILPEFANNAFIKERFLREAEAVSMLRHPKIVGIDAVGTLSDGRLCMVIPFLEGKPLDQFLAEHGGRLAPHRVVHILAHIAHGLDYVHRQGIIHRDLKPGNVFVEPTEDDRYFCKVLDFGIAKQLNTRSKRLSPTLSAPTGTPASRWRGSRPGAGRAQRQDHRAAAHHARIVDGNDRATCAGTALAQARVAWPGHRRFHRRRDARADRRPRGR